MENEQAIFQNMSIPELEAFKEMYKSNEAIVKIMNGYIEGKVKEEAQAKAKKDFKQAIANMVSTLVHPDGIANVYLAWHEVEEAQGNVEVIGVSGDGIPNGQAVGKVNKEAILALKPEVNTTILFNEKHYQVKQAIVKVWKWIPELNKGFQVGKETTTTGIKTPKKHAQTVELGGHFIGNVKSGNDGCKALGYDVAGDSGNRVLREARSNNPNYFTVKPYVGVDFTSEVDMRNNLASALA